MKGEISKRMTKIYLSDEFKIYFWDVDWGKMKKYPEPYENFIVARLADKGDSTVIKWLRRYYSIEKINSIVKNNRSVSSKTKKFWCNWEKHA